MLEVLRELGAPASIYPTPEQYGPKIDDTYYFRYPALGVDVEIDHGNRVVCLHARGPALRDVPATRAKVEGELGAPGRTADGTIARRRVALAEYADGSVEYDRAGRVLRVSRADR